MNCQGPVCVNQAYRIGLCHGHRRQKEKGLTLVPLRRKVVATLRNDQGYKECSKCREWKAEEQFGPGNSSDKKASNCYTCDRDVNLRRYYNITLEQYNQMLKDQDDMCPCGTTTEQNGQALNVDHDHSCCAEAGKSCGGCIRGLLCTPCNRALGLVKDNPDRLRILIKYLEQS